LMASNERAEVAHPIAMTAEARPASRIV